MYLDKKIATKWKVNTLPSFYLLQGFSSSTNIPGVGSPLSALQLSFLTQSVLLHMQSTLHAAVVSTALLKWILTYTPYSISQSPSVPILPLLSQVLQLLRTASREF